MSAYCTQSDIEDVFGAANVAKWSDLDNDSDAATADTTRIARAIAVASGTLEDRLRHVYAVPFSGGSLTTTVKDWCAKLAGVWLYEARGQRDALEGDVNNNTVRLHKPIVNGEIDEALSGVRRLDLTRVYSTTSTGPRVIGRGQSW